MLEYFREEYLAGRTPNPCVRCNQRMKFGFLLEQARAQGVEFDKFATGHYARVEFDEAGGRWRLRRGVDAAKDQSYFLSRLGQEQLSGLMFPLGGLRKGEVKALAREPQQRFASAREWRMALEHGGIQRRDEPSEGPKGIHSELKSWQWIGVVSLVINLLLLVLLFF